MTDRRLMPVHVDVIKEVLVDRILATVLERYPGEFGSPVETALEADLDPPLCAGGELDRRLRRVGYLTRIVEAEMFEPARAPLDALADPLGRSLGQAGDWSDAVTAVSAELAREEPLPKPEPKDERAVTWRIPGPGGHVRHYVVSAAIADALQSRGNGQGRLPAALGDPGELKRSWTYGFLVRCCEEVLPAPASPLSSS